LALKKYLDTFSLEPSRKNVTENLIISCNTLKVTHNKFGCDRTIESHEIISGLA
jgi:hypothetical protein